MESLQLSLVSCGILTFLWTFTHHFQLRINHQLTRHVALIWCYVIAVLAYLIFLVPDWCYFLIVVLYSTFEYFTELRKGRKLLRNSLIGMCLCLLMMRLFVWFPFKFYFGCSVVFLIAMTITGLSLFFTESAEDINPVLYVIILVGTGWEWFRTSSLSLHFRNEYCNVFWAYMTISELVVFLSKWIPSLQRIWKKGLRSPN